MGVLSLLSDPNRLILYVLTMVLMIFFIMPVHECAHAWMAKLLGDDTAERMGRLTLNPLAHLNPLGAAFMFFFGFGWAEPVPVQPVKFNNQKRRQGYMALVAFAGPLSNLLMALVSLILYRAIFCFDVPEDMWGSISYIMSSLVTLNVGLAVFNMLPVYPLDGSRILNWILPDKLAYKLEHFLSSVNRIAYFIGFYLVINLLSGPLYTFEIWLLNVMWSVVDGLFRAIGLGCIPIL